MRFQLSTLLLSTALVAVGMGWYLDRNLRFSKELPGTWVAVNYGVMGYSSALTFENDGSFQKVESWRHVIKTYSGRWTSDSFGNLTITLESVLLETEIDKMLGTPAGPAPFNQMHLFNWELDRTEMLVLKLTSEPPTKQLDDPCWDKHYRNPKRQ